MELMDRELPQPLVLIQVPMTHHNNSLPIEIGKQTADFISWHFRMKEEEAFWRKKTEWMNNFLFFILLFSKAVILTTNLDSKQTADHSHQLTCFFCMNFVLIFTKFFGKMKKKEEKTLKPRRIRPISPKIYCQKKKLQKNIVPKY